MSPNKKRKHEKQVMPVIPSVNPLWCWQPSFPFPWGIINGQAGRRLTGISAPGSPTLGHRCPACAGGGAPCPGEGSPDDAGVSCTNFPLLYQPGWEEIGTSGKNTIPVLIKQVKPYILMSMAMSYVHLNQPYRSISDFEGFKARPNSCHDCISWRRKGFLSSLELNGTLFRSYLTSHFIFTLGNTWALLWKSDSCVLHKAGSSMGSELNWISPFVTGTTNEPIGVRMDTTLSGQQTHLILSPWPTPEQRNYFGKLERCRWK